MVPSLLLAVAAVFWQQCVAQSWQSRGTVVALYPNVCMLCPEATFLRARGRTTIYACVQGRPVPLESWAACESYGTRCLLETRVVSAVCLQNLLLGAGWSGIGQLAEATAEGTSPYTCSHCPAAAFLTTGSGKIYRCLHGRPVLVEHWDDCIAYGANCATNPVDVSVACLQNLLSSKRSRVFGTSLNDGGNMDEEWAAGGWGFEVTAEETTPEHWDDCVAFGASCATNPVDVSVACLQRLLGSETGNTRSRTLSAPLNGMHSGNAGKETVVWYFEIRTDFGVGVMEIDLSLGPGQTHKHFKNIADICAYFGCHEAEEARFRDIITGLAADKALPPTRYPGYYPMLVQLGGRLEGATWHDFSEVPTYKLTTDNATKINIKSKPSNSTGADSSRVRKDMEVPIFVINLDQSRGRLASLQRQMDAQGTSFYRFRYVCVFVDKNNARSIMQLTCSVQQREGTHS